MLCIADGLMEDGISKMTITPHLVLGLMLSHILHSSRDEATYFVEESASAVHSGWPDGGWDQ